MKARSKKAHLSALNESVFHHCTKSQHIIRMIGKIVHSMKNRKPADVWKPKMIVKTALNEVVVHTLAKLDNVKPFHHLPPLKKKRKGTFLLRAFVPGGWVRLQAQAGYLKPSTYGMNYIPCENQVNYDSSLVFWLNNIRRVKKNKTFHRSLPFGLT